MQLNKRTHKFNNFLFFFIIIVNTSIGQVANGLKVVKHYYDWPKNTRLQEIYTINSIGQKQGTYKWYNIFSVTTSPEQEGVYKNDMLDGPSKRYYTFTSVSLSGIVKETREYKAGKLNGKEIYYDYVYNGEYASKYKSDEEVVPFIQKGKRVIREEMDYSNDVLLAKKTYHANGKNAINQKFDNAGELLSEVITNKEGVVTYENRFDEDGNFIRKFKLFQNGKTNILNEKDSSGLYVNKEFYETGFLKTEIGFDASGQKKLYEINYGTNGKIKSKTQGDNVEEYFDDGSLKESTKKNKNKDIVENIVYKSPGKLESKYALNNDGSTVFKRFDDSNECNYTYELASNKNSVKTTKKSDGGYVIEKNNITEQNLVEEVYDVTGKPISKSSTKPIAGAYNNTITIKNTNNNLGGHTETIYTTNPYADPQVAIQSIKEFDSTGTYRIQKYNNGKFYNQSTYDIKGRITSDSTREHKIDYDTTGNKIFEKIQRDGAYDEYKYQIDGIIRSRTVQKSAYEMNPPELIIKYFPAYHKNIALGKIYFDKEGNKVKLEVFDLLGNVKKEIKIKDNDETQYFNYFLKVD